MINNVQPGAEWNPRFAPHGFKQPAQSEAFKVSPEPAPEKDGGFAVFGEDGFTLLDAIDIVNPLQHLPLVGTLYRELTDDTLDPFSRVAGSTLFFGPLGTAVSGLNVAMEEFTGKDMGGHMWALLNDTETQPAETDIALKSAEQQEPAGYIKPTGAGTDGLDPVTAWAMAELNFRKAEAEKQGIVVPERSYSTLIASAASVSPNEIAQITPPPQWSRPLDDEQAVISPQPKHITPLAETIKPAEQAPLVQNEFHAIHRASPTTLLRLKQTTAAYQTVNFPTAEPLAGPTGEPSAQPSSQQKESALPSNTAPSGSETAKPAPLFSDQRSSSRPVAEKGNWFSASMVEALGKYKQTESTDKSRLDQLTSNSSLH